MFRKIAVALVAATALLGATAGTASAAPASSSSSASSSSAAGGSVQQRVDAVLASIPGGHQVSANRVDYDGLTVTVDPQRSGGVTTQAIPSCSYGYFCIVVNGTTFNFYACQWWDLNNWTGTASFNNNETPGTVFRAYDANYNQVWSSVAPQSGTVNVTPWWHIKPC